MSREPSHFTKSEEVPPVVIKLLASMSFVVVFHSSVTSWSVGVQAPPSEVIVISAPSEVVEPVSVIQFQAFRFKTEALAAFFTPSTLYSCPDDQNADKCFTSFMSSFHPRKSLISSTTLLSLSLFNFLISDRILGVMSSFGKFFTIFS